jgi:hypothetical protein
MVEIYSYLEWELQTAVAKEGSEGGKKKWKELISVANSILNALYQKNKIK